MVVLVAVVWPKGETISSRLSNSNNILMLIKLAGLA